MQFSRRSAAAFVLALGVLLSGCSLFSVDVDKNEHKDVEHEHHRSK